MPVYSYICKACEHSFDIKQTLSDAALTECPKCGGEIRKVFGKVGVTFKGSGFYRTDNASAPKSSSSSND
jgi:putative FmdB family regulatory protein